MGLNGRSYDIKKEFLKEKKIYSISKIHRNICVAIRGVNKLFSLQILVSIVLNYLLLVLTVFEVLSHDLNNLISVNFADNMIAIFEYGGKCYLYVYLANKCKDCVS